MEAEEQRKPALPLPCIIVNANQSAKWDRPGNEAAWVCMELLVCYIICLSWEGTTKRGILETCMYSRLNTELTLNTQSCEHQYLVSL